MNTNNNNMKSLEESATNMKDEICFVQRVKTAFKDERHSYDRFVAVLSEFKGRTTAGDKIDDLVDDLKDLFKDHRPLLRDFDVFLPEGCEILAAHLPPMPTEPPSPPSPLTLDDVIAFLNTLKTRLRDEEGLYRSFLDAVKRHANDDNSAAWPQLAELFNDRHPEVLRPLREIVLGEPTEMNNGKGRSKRSRSPERWETEAEAIVRRRRGRTAEYCSRRRDQEGGFEMGPRLMSTAEAVERLLKEIGVGGGEGTAEIELEEHFTAEQLRTLEKVYGAERWGKLKEAFRRDPRWNFGVALERLRRKMEMWESTRRRASQITTMYLSPHLKSSSYHA